MLNVTKTKSISFILCLLLSSLAFSGCSFFSRRSHLDKTVGKRKYTLTDKSGSFLVFYQSGITKKNNKIVVKRQVLDKNGDESKPLEKTISISKIGEVAKGISGSIPDIAQYSVWFEGKRFFSQTRILTQGKVEIKYQEGEKSAYKKKYYTLPKGTGVYCFFSQLMECIRSTGFVQKAFEMKAGKVNFYIIWDGYPFLNQQYTSMGDKMFSPATLDYDGENEKGDHRFSLLADGTSIFYFTDADGVLKKQFWVAEGLSMVEVDSYDQGPKNSEEGPEDLENE